MIGAILGGVALFAISEICGEVYHDNHKYEKKNIIINSSRKICDITTSKDEKKAEERIEDKEKVDVDESLSLEDALKELDEQIENIMKYKDQDILAAEMNLLESIIKICDVIVSENKLSEEDTNSLIEIKNQGEHIMEKLENNEFENQISVKKAISDYVLLVQTYIDKANGNVEDANVSPVQEEVAPSFNTEQEAVKPDFTKEVSPIIINESPIVEIPVPETAPEPEVTAKPEAKPKTTKSTKKTTTKTTKKTQENKEK